MLIRLSFDICMYRGTHCDDRASIASSGNEPICRGFRSLFAARESTEDAPEGEQCTRATS